MAAWNPRELDRTISSLRRPFERHLKLLVEIPTVSSDPACRGEIRRAARSVQGLFREFGARPRLLRTPGHPVVLARLGREGSHPTLMIYNHLDVQPADPTQWNGDPFTLSVRNGRYRGRGATDDKGPALTALYAARQAREMGIPINFLFVWEFEEEIGSPHLERALHPLRRELAAEAVLVSDTIWVSGKRPAIPCGLRGLLTATLDLETGTREAHSGLVGGVARNPLSELCTLLARCHDPMTGRVRIPGFYAKVRRETGRERRAFCASGFSLSGFRKAHGLKKIRSHRSDQLLPALWSRPTFEVHGITGGYTGAGVKTVVPPRAQAKISMRLVPGQRPREVFALLRDFVRKEAPDVRVRYEAGLDPYLAPPQGPHIQAAARAVEFGFGKRPALIREGGSIGAVVTLHRLSAAPVVLLGLSLPEQGYHGPNEYFEWTQARGGMRTFVDFFQRVAQMTVDRK